ncbi:glycosyltransferase [Anthocerotibacter panamensis]|uniref:glycosyltransferase n=1 Tax=Anthocerotibacter panamensis TaxID=2857077 RepID=UPI001C404037|nr:glycosyltransferase [Anthocerotibacter panamensis]
MPKPPKFSVVIPAYNVAAYIAACLRSVFAQSDGDFEVLVVDDGSTDQTARVVLSFADPRLHLIQQRNGGLAAARNTGIRAAQGELVAFLDGDDCWHPDKLAAHRQALDQDPQASISYDWSVLINTQGEHTPFFLDQTRVTLTHERLIPKNYLGNGSTAVVRRLVLEQCGGFDEQLKRCVDQELWVRLAFRGHRFRLVPRVLTEYRVRPDSFTADTQRMLQGIEDFLDRISTYAPESVARLRPLTRACTHRWIARVAFVAGDYPSARCHGQQALASDFTVLWRDPRAALTLAAIALQALTPRPLFGRLLNIGQRLLKARLETRALSPLLLLLWTGHPVLAQAPAQSNFALSATSGGGYLLGTGDRVRVTVYGYDDLSGEQVVLGDGQINLPLIGAFKVEGITLEAARQELSERLTPYVNRPQVGLSVVSPRPLRVSVVGEVNQPGPQVLSLAPVNTAATPLLLTLSKALISAGGITPSADLAHVELHRHQPDGSVVVKTLNLWQNLSKQSDFVDPVLQDQDTIVVATLPQGSDQNLQLALRSTLAPDQIAVAVGGEVHRPGAVMIAPSRTALDALAAAGGPIDGADLSNITLLRQQDGRLQAQRLNLNSANDSTQNPVLRPGDSILVPRSGWQSFFDTTLGTVLRPFNSLAQILFFFTRL